MTRPLARGRGRSDPTCGGQTGGQSGGRIGGQISSQTCGQLEIKLLFKPVVKLGGLAPHCARQRGRERKDRAPHRIGPCTRAGGPERHRISPLRNRALTSSRRRRPVLYPSRPRLPTRLTHTRDRDREEGGEGREGGGTRERARTRTREQARRAPGSRPFTLGLGGVAGAATLFASMAV